MGKDDRCYFLYSQKVTKELGHQRYLASLNFRGLNLLTTKPVAARNKFFTPTSVIPVRGCGQLLYSFFFKEKAEENNSMLW
jgi:hypothetical protein